MKVETYLPAIETMPPKERKQVLREFSKKHNSLADTVNRYETTVVVGQLIWTGIITGLFNRSSFWILFPLLVVGLFPVLLIANWLEKRCRSKNLEKFNVFLKQRPLEDERNRKLDAL